MLADAYGLPVSTGSRPAVDAYDRGLRELLGFGADPIGRFREALGHDPDFALAQAGLAVSLYLNERIPEGRAAMESATKAALSLPPRERRHVEALALWVGGRGNEAIDLMKQVLTEHRRDVVLIQRLYFIYFWQGRAADMLELTRSVWESFEGDSYALGLHAFSLEENGRFDEALALAERAIALNPRDAWAVHALAHVHYERGDNARGIEALPPRIHPCDHLGYFRNHLLWHLALMHLAAGGYEHVRRLFESVFGAIPIAIGSDLQDSVSLAWRLDLFGHPDRARWTYLGAAARNWLEQPLLVFHDLHVGMALAAAGDWPSAELQLERLRERSKKTRNRTLPEVVVPLLEGLHAFARGDYASAARRIEPIQDRIVEVGGSNAQREIFHDTLLAAALRADREDRAEALLKRRLAKRPNPGHYWATLAAPRVADR
ncbi:MAG TPA: tetratricopeptide repeat protein [Methylomirabilota bacterium]|nr:tetratricopeptide repeat protein [Methylomirabilota bacterium]